MTDLAYTLQDLDKNEYIEPLADELINPLKLYNYDNTI